MIRGFIQIKLFEKDCNLIVKGYRSFCLETIHQLYMIISRLGTSFIWNMPYTPIEVNLENTPQSHYFVTSVKGNLKELDCEFLLCIESLKLNSSFFKELSLISENVGNTISGIFDEVAKNTNKGK